MELLLWFLFMFALCFPKAFGEHLREIKFGFDNAPVRDWQAKLDEKRRRKARSHPHG